MIDKLVDFLLNVLGLFKFFYTLNPYQMGVLLRLGKFKKVISPGFGFCYPFGIDQILAENVVLETINVGPQSLTTKDGIGIVVSSIITFKIEDVKTFLLEVEGRNNAIEDCSYGAISGFFLTKTWDSLFELDLSNELSKIVRRSAKKYGVDIISVQLCDFSRCRSLRLVTFHPEKFSIV